MVSKTITLNVGAGLRAPSLLLLVAAFAGCAVPSEAQVRSPQQNAIMPVPDELTLSKLTWATMVAVHQANETGNYSVLQSLGAPGFQASNDPARLTGVFRSLRSQGIDLRNTLLVAPTYEFPPAIVERGLLRLRGTFGIRPKPVGYDLLFQPVGRDWKLFGNSIVPLELSRRQPRRGN